METMICKECGSDMSNGYCPSCGFDACLDKVNEIFIVKKNNQKIILSETELKMLSKHHDTFSKSILRFYQIHHYLTQKQYWYVLHPKRISNPKIIWYFLIGNYILTTILMWIIFTT